MDRRFPNPSCTRSLVLSSLVPDPSSLVLVCPYAPFAGTCGCPFCFVLLLLLYFCLSLVVSFCRLSNGGGQLGVGVPGQLGRRPGPVRRGHGGRAQYRRTRCCAGGRVVPHRSVDFHGAELHLTRW